jgi:hypothetical protein
MSLRAAQTSSARFAAVSYDVNGDPVRIWIGSASSCERFAMLEHRDGCTVETVLASNDLTWDVLRDSVWPDAHDTSSGASKRYRL